MVLIITPAIEGLRREWREAAESLGAGSFDYWRRIAAPSLVAPGAHDFLWTPTIGKQVADLIPGARYEVLTEAGHFPHLQDPDALTRMAMAFFSG